MYNEATAPAKIRCVCIVRESCPLLIVAQTPPGGDEVGHTSSASVSRVDF